MLFSAIVQLVVRVLREHEDRLDQLDERVGTLERRQELCAEFLADAGPSAPR